MGILEDLLLPLDPGTFFAEYWGEKFLRLDGPATKFATLMTVESFENLVKDNASFLSYPRVTMYSEGHIVHESRFTSGEQIRISGALGYREESLVDLKRVRSLLEKGATLKISQVDKFCPRLKAFANALSTELIERVHLNLYYSSPSTNAFDPHFDKHDVFILQIFGEKLWQIFEYREELPLPGLKKTRTKDYLRANRQEELLSAGQLIYLPRGFWHYAATVNSHSLHLTVGVECATSIELLRWAAERLLQNSDLRRNLPRAEEVPADLRAYIVNCIYDLLADKDQMAEFRRERLSGSISDSQVLTLPRNQFSAK